MTTAEPGRWPPARSWVVALAILIISGITSAAGNALIAVGFPDRPVPEDLVLRAVGPYLWPQYVTEIAIIGSLVLLALYLFHCARDTFPEVIALFGVMYIIRSAIMVLTPLANSFRGPGSFGLFPLDQLGMFPSGHIAAALFCVFLIDKGKATAMRHAAVVLLIIQVVALLLSHGHYSIDIIGGALLGYFVFHEWQEGRLFGSVKSALNNCAAPR